MGLGFLQEIGQLDPLLKPHADHFDYRYRQYFALKQSIEQNEGSLQEFARVCFTSFKCRFHQALDVGLLSY